MKLWDRPYLAVGRRPDRATRDRVLSRGQREGPNYP